MHDYAIYDVATGAIRPGYATMTCRADEISMQLRDGEAALRLEPGTDLTGKRVEDGALVDEA